MTAFIYRVTAADGTLVAQGDIAWPDEEGSPLDVLRRAAGELADQQGEGWINIENALAALLDATAAAGEGGVCTLMLRLSPPAPDPPPG